MSNQTRLSQGSYSQPDTPESTEPTTTQLTISDLNILEQRTDAIVDRATEPYKPGGYENATPIEYVKPIGDILNGFDLDPCASEESMLAEVSIRNDGGLLFDWEQEGIEKVWVNPPYEEKLDWLEKAAETTQSGDNTGVETVVMLLPAYTSSSWFQRYADEASLVCFLGERVAFHGESDAPFHSVYLIFGDYPARLAAYFDRTGFVTKQDHPDNNTIHVNDDNHQKLLDDIGFEDELKLRFPVENTPNNIPKSTITTTPICKDVINSEAEAIATTAIKKDPTAPAGDYIELTCIYTTSAGKEIYIVIAQSIQNPRSVYCNINTKLGWLTQEVDRIKITTNREETTEYIDQAEKHPV